MNHVMVYCQFAKKDTKSFVELWAARADFRVYLADLLSLQFPSVVVSWQPGSPSLSNWESQFMLVNFDFCLIFIFHFVWFLFRLVLISTFWLFRTKSGIFQFSLVFFSVSHSLFLFLIDLILFTPIYSNFRHTIQFNLETFAPRNEKYAPLSFPFFIFWYRRFFSCHKNSIHRSRYKINNESADFSHLLPMWNLFQNKYAQVSCWASLLFISTIWHNKRCLPGARSLPACALNWKNVFRRRH